MAAYLKTAPPHIFSPDSVPKILWGSVAALLPFVGIKILLFGVPAVGYFLVALLSAVAAEWTAKALFSRSEALLDGYAVLTAMLIACLLLPGLPLWMAAAGSFFAVFFGSEIFGGTGAGPFHPVAVGSAFLIVCFPSFFSVQSKTVFEGMSAETFFIFPVKAWNEWMLWHGERLLEAAAVLGGVLLAGQKIIRWTAPVIFLACFILTAVFFGRPWFSYPILLYAFFIIPDPVGGCPSQKGRNLFAVGAAAVVAIFGRNAADCAGLALSVLIMNAISPWLELLTPWRGKESKGTLLDPKTQV